MAANPIIKGSLSAIVFQLLETNGRMYGYEMTKAVRAQTNGKMNITEAALYPALHKLVEQGMLTTETEIVEGRMRKYYTLTKKGNKQTSKEISAIKEAMEALKLILNPRLNNG